MSETIAAETKSMRIGTADLQMITQVEKWMTTIREIRNEQQAVDSTFRVRLRPTASARG
jgi:hypothetical protein